ncbi:MAG: hypothetical protein AB202_02470 [Parcubacteria bacterium C7867-007]|nr:MAG: hypothetical protein AB202_02470 [Parcubacteria bacterium C7867-007]
MLKRLLLLTFISVGLMTTGQTYALTPSQDVSVCINTPVEKRGPDCTEKLEAFSKHVKELGESERRIKSRDDLAAGALVCVSIIIAVSALMLSRSRTSVTKVQK